MAVTAGVTNRVQMRKDLNMWLRETVVDLDKDVEETMLNAAIAGVDVMRETIDTTPSDLSRVPKDNRNWTGNMRSLVDAEVTRKRNGITVNVGWLRLGADDQYILVQEGGGTVQGKIVTAMNAIGNANRVMRQILEEDGFK